MLFISFKSVCPSGWKEFRDNCYGFAPRYMSFPKAKKMCVVRKVLSIYYQLEKLETA